MATPYVKVSYKVKGKRKEMWAIHIGTKKALGTIMHTFQKVNIEGEFDKKHYFVIDADSIIKIKPAKMNLHYVELEVIK